MTEQVPFPWPDLPFDMQQVIREMLPLVARCRLRCTSSALLEADKAYRLPPVVQKGMQSIFKETLREPCFVDYLTEWMEVTGTRTAIWLRDNVTPSSWVIDYGILGLSDPAVRIAGHFVVCSGRSATDNRSFEIVLLSRCSIEKRWPHQAGLLYMCSTRGGESGMKNWRWWSGACTACGRMGRSSEVFRGNLAAFLSKYETLLIDE